MVMEDCSSSRSSSTVGRFIRDGDSSASRKDCVCRWEEKRKVRIVRCRLHLIIVVRLVVRGVDGWSVRMFVQYDSFVSTFTACVCAVFVCLCLYRGIRGNGSTPSPKQNKTAAKPDMPRWLPEVTSFCCRGVSLVPFWIRFPCRDGALFFSVILSLMILVRLLCITDTHREREVAKRHCLSNAIK